MSSATISGLRRRIRMLRDRCSAYEVETERQKTAAVRASTPDAAPRARQAVEVGRSGGFAKLRAQLHDAERVLAEWKPVSRTQPPKSFAMMIATAIRKDA